MFQFLLNKSTPMLINTEVKQGIKLLFMWGDREITLEMQAKQAQYRTLPEFYYMASYLRELKFSGTA